MDYVKLGKTGLDVSRICLGCMTYGEPARGYPSWSLDEETSRGFIQKALDFGVNFFDTANVYSHGSSEEILGRAIKDFAPRDEIVIATKCFFPLAGVAVENKPPNGSGLSRKAIFQAIDASLQRLGTDYVDLYYIHRWDYATPIEETMEALHDVVKAGKALHIGASSMFAHQFAKAQHVAAMNGFTRFVAMQNLVNLLYREEEREMLPLCADQGVGVIPWSPLARGRLTRPMAEVTERQRQDAMNQRMGEAAKDMEERIREAVAQVAAQRGVSRAQIALAWVMNKPEVTAPIIGATKLEHLSDAVEAAKITLSEEEKRLLEAPYAPQAVFGHS